MLDTWDRDPPALTGEQLAGRLELAGEYEHRRRIRARDQANLAPG